MKKPAGWIRVAISFLAISLLLGFFLAWSCKQASLEKIERIGREISAIESRVPEEHLAKTRQKLVERKKSEEKLLASINNSWAQRVFEAIFGQCQTGGSR